MNSVIGIDVATPPDLVFRLARDVERWSVLLPHYVRSRVGAPGPDGTRLTAFVARRPLMPILGLGLPVAWRARTWADPIALTLHFVHVAGATKGMVVTWRIVATASGSRVDIEHEFRPRLPGFASFVDRAFTRPIAGRTLATFKALAEAVVES